jgi:hypothetical protein
MPVRSNPFQKLVTLINACIKDPRTRIQESAEFIDKTNGEKREVDIAITGEMGEYSIVISIEVVDTGRKADTTWVEKMNAKHAHLPTHKLILVSHKGFYKPALEKARFLNIETMSFEDALKTDWDLVTKMTSSGFFELTTFNYKCSAIWGENGAEENFKPVSIHTSVFQPNQAEPTDFSIMVNSFLNEPKIKDVLYEQLKSTKERTFHLVYTPQKGITVLDANKNKTPLLQLLITLEIVHKSTPIKFSTGRYGNFEVAHGMPSDSKDHLYFAFIRKSNGQVSGMMLDEKGLRSLSVTKG